MVGLRTYQHPCTYRPRDRAVLGVGCEIVNEEREMHCDSGFQHLFIELSKTGD